MAKRDKIVQIVCRQNAVVTCIVTKALDTNYRTNMHGTPHLPAPHTTTANEQIHIWNAWQSGRKMKEKRQFNSNHKEASQRISLNKLFDIENYSTTVCLCICLAFEPYRSIMSACDPPVKDTPSTDESKKTTLEYDVTGRNRYSVQHFNVIFIIVQVKHSSSIFECSKRTGRTQQQWTHWISAQMQYQASKHWGIAKTTCVPKLVMYTIHTLLSSLVRDSVPPPPNKNHKKHIRIGRSIESRPSTKTIWIGISTFPSLPRCCGMCAAACACFDISFSSSSSLWIFT